MTTSAPRKRVPRADHIAINRCRPQRGVAEPALHQVRRDIGLEGIHAEAVPQSLGRGVRAGDIGRRHDHLDPPPGGRAAPAPEPVVGKAGINLPAA